MVNYMYNVVKFEVEGGYYLFKLGKVLKDRNITMNKLLMDTNTEFIVIKRLVSGELSRLDLSVISRICNYLHCKMQDIIEYIPY